MAAFCPRAGPRVQAAAHIVALAGPRPAPHLSSAAKSARGDSGTRPASRTRAATMLWDPAGAALAACFASRKLSVAPTRFAERRMLLHCILGFLRAFLDRLAGLAGGLGGRILRLLHDVLGGIFRFLRGAFGRLFGLLGRMLGGIFRRLSGVLGGVRSLVRGLLGGL